MVYSKDTYTSRMMYLVIFLCFNNLCLVYNITGIFDTIRIPVQLLAIFYITLKMMVGFNTFKKVPNDKYSRSVISIIMLISYLCIQIVFQRSNETSLLNNLSNGIFSLLLYLYFMIGSESKCNVNYEKLSCVALLILCPVFIYFRINMPLTGAPTHIYHAQYVNSIYYIVLLLPFGLRSRWRYLLIGMVGLCVLFSGKQGAFLAVVIGVICFYMSERKVFDNSLGKKSKIWIVVLGIIVVFAYDYVSTNMEFDILRGFQSLEDDGGNGRLEIYQHLLTLIKQSSFIELVLGHGGMNAVFNRLGISAHNDFIEILFDFGFIGFILYAIFIVSLISCYLKLINIKSQLAPSLIYTIVVFLVLSMVSHLIFVLKYCMLLMSFLGIIMFEARKEEIEWKKAKRESKSL